MIQVCKTGKNPTMRHLGRTHRVDVHWLHERFQGPSFISYKEDTKGMRADIFTKGFTDIEKWNWALYLVNHVDPRYFWKYNPEVPVIDIGAGGDDVSGCADGPTNSAPGMGGAVGRADGPTNADDPHEPAMPADMCEDDP